MDILKANKLTSQRYIENGYNIQEVLLVDLARVGPQVLLSVCAMGILVCYFAYDSLSPWYWGSWLLLLVGVSFARFWLIKYLARDCSLPIKHRVNLVSLITFFAGISHSLGLLFFPELSFSERAIQTLMHLGFAAGSIPSSGGYRPFYFWFTSSTLMSLAIAWIVFPSQEVSQVMRMIIAGMVISFYFFDTKLAKNYFNFYEYSYKASQQLTDAKKKLEVSNRALADALDKAVDASESKTRFLAAASHDLRQPIHTLSLFGAALSLQDLDEKTKQISDRMEVSIKNLADQLEGLLDISKLDAGVVIADNSHFDLALLIRQILDEFKPIVDEHGIELALHCRHTQCVTYSDYQLLTRLIQNLVSNAIKYTSEGSVELSITESLYAWRLSVTDTGCGIADIDKERIFDEFFQVGKREQDRAMGLGLGLAIVKRLCCILDVEISLDSEVNRGSQFDLLIKKSESSITVKSEPEHEHFSIKGLNILCVDNEESILVALEALLTEFGCNVQVCDSLKSSISLLENITPDIVISDLRLDGEESGVDAVRAIRSIIGDVPAIIISGETDARSIHSVVSEGLPLLHKPLSGKKLKWELAKLAEII